MKTTYKLTLPNISITGNFAFIQREAAGLTLNQTTLGDGLAYMQIGSMNKFEYPDHFDGDLPFTLEIVEDKRMNDMFLAYSFLSPSVKHCLYQCGTRAAIIAANNATTEEGKKRAELLHAFFTGI